MRRERADMGGVTFIEINYDSQWVENSLAGVQGFSWLFEWGMYIFLLIALAILFWIFFDSITKKNDQQALVPRILAMIGLFAVMPAFIFRFTGTADGITTRVLLRAEGDVYYAGPINWNVNWLVSGYGPIIAIVALFGMVLSILAVVIYASSVHRTSVEIGGTSGTQFVKAVDSKIARIENKVDQANRAQASSAAAGASASSLAQAVDRSRVRSDTAKTIMDRKGTAATVIDVPQSGATVVVQGSNGRGISYGLPAGNAVVGRDAQCYIVLDDDKVSRRHAEFSYEANVFYISDLGSANGTYVNGVRVQGRQMLTEGNIIKVGDTTLQYHVARQGE